jgi:hypothetical protein
MSVTITFHLWWLLAYLAIGVVLVLPINWLALQQILAPRPQFWEMVRRHPWGNLLTVTLWPAALWELLT